MSRRKVRETSAPPLSSAVPLKRGLTPNEKAVQLAADAFRNERGLLFEGFRVAFHLPDKRQRPHNRRSGG